MVEDGDPGLMKPGDILVSRISGSMWDRSYVGLIVSVSRDKFSWIDEVGYNVLWRNGRLSWELAEDISRNYCVFE